MAEDFHGLLRQLYTSQYNHLLRYAVSYLRDRHLAQDMVQDTFHEALNHPQRLLEHPKPEAWLMQTLKYKVQNAAKARAREYARFLSLDAENLPRTPGKDMGAELEKLGTEAILLTARQVLQPEEYRLLIRLAVDRVGYAVAAGESGITVWNAYKRMERIRKKLSQALFEDD